MSAGTHSQFANSSHFPKIKEKLQYNKRGILPRIHLHVMSVEEEDCGRYQRNVKILDINLNIL